MGSVKGSTLDLVARDAGEDWFVVGPAGFRDRVAQVAREARPRATDHGPAVELTEDELSPILCESLRYVMGRSSYAPGAWCWCVRDLADDLPATLADDLTRVMRSWLAAYDATESWREYVGEEDVEAFRRLAVLLEDREGERQGPELP